MREGSVTRKTKETSIEVRVNLDGTGVYDVSTGIGFLDHMLEQLSRHSLMDLYVRAEGDLHIDFHHTTEDTGIAIGQAVNQALGDNSGITRFASAYIPMDETLSRVALDISARPYLIWRVDFSKPSLAIWTQSSLKSGSRHLPKRRELRCMLRIYMVRTITILWNHALKDWRGPCGRR